MRWGDDFLGDEIDGKWATADVDEGSLGLSTASRGIIRATTSTTDNAHNHIVSVLQWKCDMGLTFEACVRSVTAITTRAINIGLTDTAAADEMPIELATATFTSTASDFLGFVFDTDANAANLYWHAVGVAADTDSTANTEVVPVADTWQRFTIKVNKDGDAQFLINGIKRAELATCVTTTTLLTPIFAIENRSGVATSVDLDYLWIEAGREYP
jgi:hypothetical protein